MAVAYFSPQALRDLAEIEARIEEQDPSTASSVIQRIEHDIEMVCLFPHIGKPIDKPAVLIFGGRKKQPFRFTFSVTDGKITVLRIFRHSRGSILT